MIARGAALLVAAMVLAGPAARALETDAPETRPSTPDMAEPTRAESAKPVKAVPESMGEAVGTWDLSLDGSNRRCIVTLSEENSANGRVLRFPAGCRRAIPALADAVGWLFADGGIRFIDRNIRPLLQFSARQDKASLSATTDRGVYSLVPLQTVAMLPAEPAPLPESQAPPAPRSDAPTAIPDVANARPIPGAAPVLPSKTLTPPANRPTDGPPTPTPGIYALDRFERKDVCRIELGATVQPNLEIAPARLLPGCNDSGITVFDPASWKFANGHMTLKARRGHAVNLVATGEGSWRRDPDVGTTFVLRKVEP